VRFRFRPRYRFVPFVLLAVSACLAGSALAGAVPGAGGTIAVVFAVVGVAAALGYWLSPAWRLEVFVEPEALVIRRGDDVRLHLPWGEVLAVRHSPAHQTMLVDGGAPSRRLLVPGPDAPGPYRIEHREALCAAILARVPADRVVEAARPLER
jgi:hypothetical protein